MKYKIENKTQKEWNGKHFIEATLMDEAGAEFKVSAWAGEFSGETFEGEIEKNDKGYWRLKKPKLEKPNFMKAKEAVMEKAMEKKDMNIRLAQDRSAWMWAKTNASTLLGTGAGTNDDEVFDRFIALATKIYNAEPDTPFN